MIVFVCTFSWEVFNVFQSLGLRNPVLFARLTFFCMWISFCWNVHSSIRSNCSSPFAFSHLPSLQYKRLAHRFSLLYCQLVLHKGLTDGVKIFIQWENPVNYLSFAFLPYSQKITVVELLLLVSLFVRVLNLLVAEFIMAMCSPFYPQQNLYYVISPIYCKFNNSIFLQALSVTFYIFSFFKHLYLWFKFYLWF